MAKWLEKEVVSTIDGIPPIEEWQSARCSACGKYHTTPYMYYFDEYKFCPNCGQAMDGKDEPQTNADQHVQRIEYVGNDGRVRCWKCNHFKSMHQTPISSDGRYYTYVVCTASKCRFEPKDEPQEREGES